MDKFNDYVNENFAEEKGIPQDWVYTTLTNQMQQIMIHLFQSVKHKLQAKVGYFDLFGLDFMVDENMKVKILTLVLLEDSLVKTKQCKSLEKSLKP